MPRRPQPTRLKILKNNPGKRPLNRAEPSPPTDGIEPPAWLTGVALDKWNELLPLLQEVRLMTRADIGTLARYVDTWAWWRRCREVIEREGDTLVMRDDQGNEKYRQQRPEVGIVNRLAQQLCRLENEFGLSPASRAGLQAVPQEAPDELTEFLKTHGA
jgi:P27 family predicted phage terminase small subunit